MFSIYFISIRAFTVAGAKFKAKIEKLKEKPIALTLDWLENYDL